MLWYIYPTLSLWKTYWRTDTCCCGWILIECPNISIVILGFAIVAFVSHVMSGKKVLYDKFYFCLRIFCLMQPIIIVLQVHPFIIKLYFIIYYFYISFRSLCCHIGPNLINKRCRSLIIIHIIIYKVVTVTAGMIWSVSCIQYFHTNPDLEKNSMTCSGHNKYVCRVWQSLS